MNSQSQGLGSSRRLDSLEMHMNPQVNDSERRGNLKKFTRISKEQESRCSLESRTYWEERKLTTSKLIQLCDSEMQENHGPLESLRFKDSDWCISEMWSCLPQPADHGLLHVIHSCRCPLKTRIKHSTSAVSCIPTRIKDSKLSWQISQCRGPPKTRIKHSTSAVSWKPTRIKDSKLSWQIS